jgi:hypothetical protein
MSDAHFGQTLGLIFEECTEGPLEQPPTFAQIYLQTFTTAKRDGFESVHLLTPVNVTPEEFDYHADRLIENIQRLKREARQKFARARKAELARL